MNQTSVDFIDKTSFSNLVEATTREKHITHFEAILDICKTKNIEVESIPELLTTKLRKMIQNEAINLNLLKKSKTRRLPL
jgi:hypothetical protein